MCCKQLQIDLVNYRINLYVLIPGCGVVLIDTLAKWLNSVTLRGSAR